MAANKKFIIGSRGSKLSLAYSKHVKRLLLKSIPEFKDDFIEIKIINDPIHVQKSGISENKNIPKIEAQINFVKCRGITNEHHYDY